MIQIMLWGLRVDGNFKYLISDPGVVLPMMLASSLVILAGVMTNVFTKRKP